MPQQAAGMRTEPPVSVPRATSASPSATTTAEPLEEPPGTRAGSSGLTGVPVCSLTPSANQHSSLRLVLPMMRPPEPAYRSDAGSVRGGRRQSPRAARAPTVVTVPATSMASLTATVGPSPGGGVEPQQPGRSLLHRTVLMPRRNGPRAAGHDVGDVHLASRAARPRRSRAPPAPTPRGTPPAVAAHGTRSPPPPPRASARRYGFATDDAVDRRHRRRPGPRTPGAASRHPTARRPAPHDALEVAHIAGHRGRVAQAAGDDRHARQCVTPPSTAAKAIDEPFGEGSTSRLSGSMSSRLAGDSVGPSCEPRLPARTAPMSRASSAGLLATRVRPDPRAALDGDGHRGGEGQHVDHDDTSLRSASIRAPSGPHSSATRMAGAYASAVSPRARRRNRAFAPYRPAGSAGVRGSASSSQRCSSAARSACSARRSASSASTRSWSVAAAAIRRAAGPPGRAASPAAAPAAPAPCEPRASSPRPALRYPLPAWTCQRSRVGTPRVSLDKLRRRRGAGRGTRRRRRAGRAAGRRRAGRRSRSQTRSRKYRSCETTSRVPAQPSSRSSSAVSVSMSRSLVGSSSTQDVGLVHQQPQQLQPAPLAAGQVADRRPLARRRRTRTARTAGWRSSSVPCRGRPHGGRPRPPRAPAATAVQLDDLLREVRRRAR